jgi:hypothetical protein
MKVVFHSHTGDEPKLLGTWSLGPGNRALCDSPRLERLVSDASPLVVTGGLVSAENGVAFLRALPLNFSGSALRATLYEN